MKYRYFVSYVCSNGIVGRIFVTRKTKIESSEDINVIEMEISSDYYRSEISIIITNFILLKRIWL